MWHSLQAWRGPLLIAGVAAVVLWLYFSGNLSLYIHPRYHLFTAVMSVIAVVAVVIGTGYQASRPDDEHDEHDSGSKVAFVASTVLSVGTLLALILIPPATLGTTTVDNRAINQSGLGDTQTVLDQAE